MKTFETASFHIVKPCNMKCKFCYATFEDMNLRQQLSKVDTFIILEKLKQAGVEKITFAGGEPFLYKWLFESAEYAKNIGFTTSIITNGSLLTEEELYKYKDKLDWIGISVDSLNKYTNQDIGRYSKLSPVYHSLVIKVKDFGFKLKINTVVNSYNKNEDLNEFISWANPERWKVFQALRVDGQNEKQFDEIKVSKKEYENFIEKHIQQKSMVAENNEAMTGSYLLIDPQGRLFENSQGKHTYSDSLVENNFEKCLSQINLNREIFEKRGGVYNW